MTDRPERRQVHPGARWAAAGAKTSRPWKVALTLENRCRGDSMDTADSRP